MVVDCCTYNGERDLLRLRLNILKDYVDEFIIVEAGTTFSGKKKPLYFLDVLDEIQPLAKKITYYINEENYSLKEVELAVSSPNTKGASHWTHEFLQKERIKNALTHLKDDDIVFIGDCDEIWQPNQLYPDIGKLKLRVYTYYLNNRSSEQFWGTLVGKWKYIKNECLNHLRSNPPLISDTDMGWHFTSLKDGLRRKLTDSYTEETYATKYVMDNLDENVRDNKDFLGRKFTYKTDESEWPTYLRDNREKYKHLLYDST